MGSGESTNPEVRSPDVNCCLTTSTLSLFPPALASEGDHLETRTETTARIVVKIHEVQFLTNVYVQRSAVVADHVFAQCFIRLWLSAQL